MSDMLKLALEAENVSFSAGYLASLLFIAASCMESGTDEQNALFAAHEYARQVGGRAKELAAKMYASEWEGGAE